LATAAATRPDRDTGRQLAALPYRRGQSGLEFALVTSRETGRWIVPKGWPMDGRTDWDAAALEAFEEAGLAGEIESRPIGAFSYLKRRATRGDIRCEVSVFPLRVDREEKDWPERRQRTRRWFSPAEAAEVVEEPELKALILGFTGR
jgi:8-oxo-dGTP pyrophosphatase MutT (NUDIX family)